MFRSAGILLVFVVFATSTAASAGEHVGSFMGFISYFGELTVFSPPKVRPEVEKKLCFEEHYE